MKFEYEWVEDRYLGPVERMEFLNRRGDEGWLCLEMNHPSSGDELRSVYIFVREKRP
jgi:hypothetical protein